MSLHEIRQKRELILNVAARHGARNLRMFGSVVSGQQRPDSDLCLAATPRMRKSSF